MDYLFCERASVREKPERNKFQLYGQTITNLSSVLTRETYEILLLGREEGRGRQASEKFWGPALFDGEREEIGEPFLCFLFFSSSYLIAFIFLPTTTTTTNAKTVLSGLVCFLNTFFFPFR
jgi:hypothetical protein